MKAMAVAIAPVAKAPARLRVRPSQGNWRQGVSWAQVAPCESAIPVIVERLVGGGVRPGSGRAPGIDFYSGFTSWTAFPAAVLRHGGRKGRPS